MERIKYGWLIMLICFFPFFGLAQKGIDGKSVEKMLIEFYDGLKDTVKLDIHSGARVGGFSELTFSIRNAQIISTTPTQLRFDIFVQANANNTYLDNCVLRLYYEPEMLGTNITAAGAVHVTKGSAFNNNKYSLLYYDVVWHANNLLGIALTTMGNSASLSRTLITTTPQLLAQCQITIQNCRPSTTLNLAQFFQDDIDVNTDDYIRYTTSATASQYNFFKYDYIRTVDVFGRSSVQNLCKSFDEGFTNYGSPVYGSQLTTCTTGATIVRPGAYLYMQAEQSISFKPGFTASAGSQVTARIGTATTTSFNCGQLGSLSVASDASLFPNPNTNRVLHFEEFFAEQEVLEDGKVELV